MQKPVLLFFLLVLVSAGVEVTSFWMAMKKMNNLWMIQWYHLLNVSIIIYILSGWHSETGMKKLFRWSLFLFVVFWGAAKLTFEPLTGDDQYTYTTASILILAYVILTLFQFIQDEEKNFLSDCRFWIACGIFFYYTGNFILFSVFKWFTALSLIDALTVWNVHWWLNAVINLIYLRAFLLVR